MLRLILLHFVGQAQIFRRDKLAFNIWLHCDPGNIMCILWASGPELENEIIITAVKGSIKVKKS